MIIKNLGRNFFINLFLVLLIFLLDRISKIYIINLDKKLIGSEIYSSKYLNINLIWNDELENQEKLKLNENVRSWLKFQLENDVFEIRSNSE